MPYRTNEDKRGHLRTPLETDCFSVFICVGLKKESNMDGWKYVSANGRKESGFENLKTRFRDCNLSRKQENKRDGMIERKQPFNRERKQSVFVERLKMKKKGSNQERSHSLFRASNMERKQTIRPSVRMENNKDVSQ